MVYDLRKKAYLKKETLLCLNLMSKSSPDKAKLVGRLTIDLANILNHNILKGVQEKPLEYCSVNGFLAFSIAFINKK